MTVKFTQPSARRDLIAEIELMTDKDKLQELAEDYMEMTAFIYHKLRMGRTQDALVRGDIFGRMINIKRHILRECSLINK